MIFSKTIPCKELGFFALRSVHQDASFEPSKTVFLTIFRIFHQYSESRKFGIFISLVKMHVVASTKRQRMRYKMTAVIKEKTPLRQIPCQLMRNLFS